MSSVSHSAPHYINITQLTVHWVAPALGKIHDSARRYPGRTLWTLAPPAGRQIGIWYSPEPAGGWRILVFPAHAGMARAHQWEGQAIARYLGLTPLVMSDGEGTVTQRPYLAVFGGGVLGETYAKRERDNETTPE